MVVVSKDVKPHVAFLSSPGMGHIIPLFEFAKYLVSNHGLIVSFLVINTDASEAQNQLFQSPTIPSGLNIVNIPPADMSNVITEDTRILSRICLTVQESLKSLPSILVQINPQVLIFDIFTSQAVDAAKELSIPAYFFFTSPASFLAFLFYLPTLDGEVEGEFVDLPEPIKVPGRRPERIEDLFDEIKNRKIDEYKWVFNHISRLTLADGVFVNSWEDLEPLSLKALREHEFYKSISTPPVHPIGPQINRDVFTSEKDAKIVAWLDDQPADSVLFVVFGSGGTLSTEQLNELAWGLEMSEQRFILVVRKPFDASASAEFFNAGNELDNDPSTYLPEGFVKRTEGVGLIVPSWAPQTVILRHASTGAILSHCGWNSTLESLSHGVPIIAWPLFAEQRTNATLLEEEIGVAVKPVLQPGKSVIGREEIERVVRLMMEGEEGKALRSKAKMLKVSAEKALNHGGSSSSSISRVVDLWKSKC